MTIELKRQKHIMVFHNILVVVVLCLFITGDEEDFIVLHENAGYFVVLLLLYRLFIKKAKTKQSTFKQYFKNLLHLKHSAIKTILVTLLIFIVLTGIIGYTASEDEGYLSYVISLPHAIGKTFENIHSFLTNILLVFIAIHIFTKRKNIMKKMKKIL